MNTGLKQWKEAASLILTAGRTLGGNRLSSRTPLDGSGASSRFDYDVLLLKRSAKSTFMPNAYVFPGGLVDSSDFSSDWLNVFKSFLNSPAFGLRNVEQPVETRPPIFATNRLKLGSPIPGEVALRICALRETFEESGVLLVVPKKEEKRLIKSPHDTFCSPHYTEYKLCSDELSKWRALVNKSPSNFIRMCQELEVLPNIWALHEWANWLTPVGIYGSRRFDTAFFMCCLQEIPSTLQDEKEIVHFQWSTPSEILQSYQARQLWIAPPQFYELSRMCRLPLLNDLHSFAHQRATEGCDQWLPVILQDQQCISLLPGDKLYPRDSSKQAEGDHTQLEEQPDDSDLHRIVISDPYTTTLQITVKPKYNHLLPVMEPALSHNLKGQL